MRNCKNELHEKISRASGRINLLLAEISKFSRTSDEEETKQIQENIYMMAWEFGQKWLDQTADLFKEEYNRRSGP